MGILNFFNKNSGKTLKAEYTGELLIGDSKIPCAVLNDGTRLITQAGFLSAIGRSKQTSGVSPLDSDLPPFLATNNLKEFISDDLKKNITPIAFKTSKGKKAFGYNAELIPQVSSIYLQARKEGKLHKNQERFAQQCENLIIGLAHTGITALVDEATGYQNKRKNDNLSIVLNSFLAKELLPYERKFPDEYYKQIYRLKGKGEYVRKWADGKYKNTPAYIGTITNNIIYNRLPKGVLEKIKELNPRNNNGNRSKRYFQLLSEEVGVPALEGIIPGVISLMRSCNDNDWDEFESRLDKAYPLQD